MPDRGDLRKLSSDKPSCFFPPHGTWIPGISIIYKWFKTSWYSEIEETGPIEENSHHVFAPDVECECLFVCLTVCVCASPWVVMRCSAAMDILFLMDGSYSVGKGSFERSKHYAIKLCQALDIGPDKVSKLLGLRLSVFWSFFFFYKICHVTRCRVAGATASVEMPRPAWPQPVSPKHSQVSWERLSLKRGLGLPQGLLPVGRALNSTPGRLPGGIQARCLIHLSWLLSMWRSSSLF